MLKDTLPKRAFGFLPRGLWPLWSAGLISTAGDSLHNVAILWLIYELTGSKTATGLIGMAQYLPSVVVGLFAGTLVDRLNRKHVMIAADAARVILVALIPTLYIMGLMSGLLLGLLAFAVAMFTTVFNPAREAIIPQLVEPGDLLAANSVLQGSYGLAWFMGPVLAAALLPFIPVSGLFYADSLTYAASLVLLLWLRPRTRPTAMVASAPLAAIGEGLRYAKRSGIIRGLLLITAVDNLFIMGPALVGTPLYVRLHLGLGASAYAAVEAAFALGFVVGTILIHRFGERLPRGRVLLWALLFDGITFVPFFFLHTLGPVLAVWFIHSIGIPFIIIPRTTLIQTGVPGELQGRIFSLVNLTVVGLSAVSCALTGIVAEAVPMPNLYAIIGLSATVVSVCGWLNRDLRRAI